MIHICKPHKNQLIRGYKSSRDRNIAITQLHKKGWNYFVCYVDVQSHYALLVGNADWVEPGGKHVCR